MQAEEVNDVPGERVDRPVGDAVDKYVDKPVDGLVESVHAVDGQLDVPVEEPPQPTRVRQPIDLLRALLGLALTALLLLLGGFALDTFTGLEADIAHGGDVAPPFLIHLLVNTLRTLSGAALFVLPVWLAVERLFRGDRRRLLDAALAAALAAVATSALNWWITGPGPDRLEQAISRVGPYGAQTAPTSAFLAGLVAYVTVVGLAQRPRWQALIWGTLTLNAVAALLGRYGTPLGVGVSIALARTVGFTVRWVLGTGNVRPPGTAVVAALRRVGLDVRSCRRRDPGEDSRGYQVTTASGSEVDVYVLDRDQQGVGLLYRLYRRARLRKAVARRAHLSVRRALEHEALMSYAVAASGVRTPKLVAATEVGPDAALLAYEHVPGRTVAEIEAGGGQLTDGHLAALWTELGRLQAHRLAHRELVAGNLLIAEDGSGCLLDLRSGEIAASELSLRLDTAQLLVTLALKVGSARAVRSGSETLGPDAVAAAMPLLQPVALSRETRAELRNRRELLSEIRRAVLAVRPEAEVEPVNLVRLRTRTVLSVVGLTAALYFLISQLTNVDIVKVVREAQWGWAGVALGAAGLTYLGAGLSLMGFVPERLSLWRTTLAQLGASFVKLVTPAAVGGVALNTRYLQRAGIAPGLAAASVGVAQLSGLAFNIVLIGLFGYLTGTGTGSAEDLAPSSRALVLIGTLLVVGAAAGLLPPVRRLLASRVKPLFTGVWPRLLDVVQRPVKLGMGLGGSLLLTLAFMLCLYTSVLAFGGRVGFATVALVFLTGNTIGSAAPTPGGLGAVEATLAAGLTAAGLTGDVAVSAVLLFRLLTFWLPVLPGWLAFTWLTQRGDL
ncbi:MAG: flippase-like domain-containing protein [Mycobacteriales bacterium]